MKKILFALAAMAAFGFAAEARADVYFCGQGKVSAAPMTNNEVGLVISEATSATQSGTVVAKMNNFYGDGAGNYWTSGLSTKPLEGGTSCWLLAGSTKQSKPSGKSAWGCGYATVNDISNEGFSVTFQDSRDPKIMFIASFLGDSFDMTTLSTTHGGPNCPPPGQ